MEFKGNLRVGNGTCKSVISCLFLICGIDIVSVSSPLHHSLYSPVHNFFSLSCSPSVGECLIYRKIGTEEHFSKVYRNAEILPVVMLVLENINLILSILNDYAM